jgi:hypothetical protein
LDERTQSLANGELTKLSEDLKILRESFFDFGEKIDGKLRNEPLDVDVLIAELEKTAKLYDDRAHEEDARGNFGKARGISYAIGVIERHASKAKGAGE